MVSAFGSTCTQLRARNAGMILELRRSSRCGSEFTEPRSEEIEAFVEIVRLRPEKELVNLRTVCSNAAGEIACEGEALVLVRDVHAP